MKHIFKVSINSAKRCFSNKAIIPLFFVFGLIPLFAQSYLDSVEIRQMTDGSGMAMVCYNAYNIYDSLISTNMQAAMPGVASWNISVVTILDTLSEYSEGPNYGWRVSASEEGERHCFIWNVENDIGLVEACDFNARIAVFDSIVTAFALDDSFPVHDTLAPDVRAFGLTYRHGALWLLFHHEITHDCWIQSYTLPEMTPVDSFYIGSVTVGPSDMTFAGGRLFWVEDTRVLLKEFDFETRESNTLRGDWWDLPGTENHLAGAAFDGENLWLCFCEGTFVCLDTADFSLVDTMFFPDFGISVPATCADGLAWGLGLLWCYSNDNIVYAIDIESKTIIHDIPTGDVVDDRGPEGCTWDGTNLWVVDYGRGNIYKLSLFEQVRFYSPPQFCLDNIPPALDWYFPSCPDGTDTLTAGDTVEISWFATDSNLSGGITRIMMYDDTIAIQPSIDTTFDWEVLPWHGWHGFFDLIVIDSFGFSSSLNSCNFFIVDTAAVIEYKSIPGELSISAQPNPFNSSCRISAPAGAKVEIFDLRGNAVWQTKLGDANEQSKRTAKHENQCEALWQPDASISSGIYLIRAAADEKTMTKRVVYLR